MILDSPTDSDGRALRLTSPEAELEAAQAWQDGRAQLGRSLVTDEPLELVWCSDVAWSAPADLPILD